MTKTPQKPPKRTQRLYALAAALASSSLVTTLVVVAIDYPKLPKWAGE